ncbi:hypothetical protein C8R47DRAFT_1278815 [Mycena vitilis]|nr:hypothetical protein C8R47DRAFT_1278815 [Mycena vitilis]
MLIKLTPPTSPTPTPTILFALAFADPPQNLPLPTAWATQLARLAADDLEAPPALHALDRAAAFPSLLAEVLFDLPQSRIACSFLDGATEDWALPPSCAEMLARVISDVEESGLAEERAREWQRALEAERARVENEQQTAEEQEKERQQQREQEREAEMDREYEEKMQMQRTKGKGKEQSLNSPPASMKGTRSKGRLHKSRSLLMALVATFSPSSSSSASSSSLPPASVSPPATRTSFSGTSPRSPSPLRAFARRASFSALSSVARADSASTSTPMPSRSDSPPPAPSYARSASSSSSTAPPPAPRRSSIHNLETPPSSAPPSAPSSAFATQQTRARPPLDRMSPRALRRRARSTLVDAFRAHVLPELRARVGLFEPSGTPRRVPSEAEDADIDAPGGGYPAWVARSMLRRAEARMRELEGQWPALATRRSAHARAASGSGSDSQGPRSPIAIAFPGSVPASPTRLATFEPWSSEDESGSETESETEGEGGSEAGSEGESLGGGFTEDEDEDDSDGSSVHTPESGHSIGYGHRHVQEASSSTTSSYFTCGDDNDEEGEESDAPPPTVSHIRGTAQSHARRVSERSEKRAQRERKRAGRAARAEHTAFVRMTARLRRVLEQGAAARSVARVQRMEGERLREGRGVRRAWLDRKGGTKAALVRAQAFRPSGLRGAWDATDVEEEEDAAQEQPPAYEDVVAQTPVPHALRRMRPSPPRHRAHKALPLLDEFDRDVDFEEALEGIDIEVDLEHLELSDALDIEGMALAVDGDLDDELVFGGVDVFADVSGKGRTRARRVPVPLSGKGKGKGLVEAWARRRPVVV